MEVDEDRVYRLVATVDGVVRELRPNSAGRFVEQDEVLLTYYSSEFLGAQQAFYYALNTRDRISAASSEPTEQIDPHQRPAAVGGGHAAQPRDERHADRANWARRGSWCATSSCVRRSPGYVLSRTVFPKQRLERGAELYRIADLGRLWVLADLFESDVPYVRPGTEASLTFQTRSGAPIRAPISNVLPKFDRATGP